MTNIEIDNAIGIFRLPYRSWPQDKILAYFQSRTEISYFPVVDGDETTREKIDNILLNRFEFNHELHQLTDHFDWASNPSRDIEWLILLHKFYYAVGLGIAYHETKNQRYFEKWMDLTSSWIDTVQLDHLSSDVAGRRIQNWIFAHYYFVTLNSCVSVSESFYLKFLKSIHDQVAYLIDHLTPARNHRTLELYAVFLAAVVFPEMKQATAWLDFAKEELLKNIQKDILSDGVHCELSTDYHHIVLKNYLNIRQLAAMNQISMPKEIDIQIKKALEFSLFVHKPDGLIPSLSDGDTRSFLELLEKGARFYQSEEMLYVASKGKSGHAPSVRSKGFPKGGYYILRSGWGDGAAPYEDERYLVFDCGPLGEGNHGHFDLLSFEMAAYGQSLVVDPGRYTYDEFGEINWRVRFRGTAYHNTVLIDQKNQTAYRPGKKKFKIKGPEPAYELKSFVTRRGFDYLHGIARSHEYEVVHERKIFFVALEYWIISDLLNAQEEHDYDLHFHLSDQAFEKVSVTTEQETLLVSAPNLLMAQPIDSGGLHFVEDAYISKVYGAKLRAPVIRFARKAANADFHTILYPYKNTHERPQISVKRLPVLCGETLCDASQGFALSITLTKGGQSYQDSYFSANPTFGKRYTFKEYEYNGSFLYVRQDVEGNVLAFHHDPETEVGAYSDLLL